MKKPLYYAIRTGSLYNPVIAVTSERGHRWGGRDEANNQFATHGVLTDLSGRFDTLEAAKAAREYVVQVADSYDKARNVLNNEANRLYRQERKAVDALLRGEPLVLAVIPTITYQAPE